jgi:MoxR-like ATPase
MEAALDSGQISIEIPGQSLQSYPMHKDFRLIATQNPNEGRFAVKRENLTAKFLSRFSPVEFPEITKAELLAIARGQARHFRYQNVQVISQLINFHSDWSCAETKRNSSHCFTIRDVAATIRAISRQPQTSKNAFDAVMTFYGMRYPSDIRESIVKDLRSKYPALHCQSEPYEMPARYPSCFHNKVIQNAVKHILSAFENQRNVLLIGKEGSGLTQIARWSAEYYSGLRDQKQQSNSSFCFVCTPETTISDWIGRYILVPKSDESIRWRNGPLTRPSFGDIVAFLMVLMQRPQK